MIAALGFHLAACSLPDIAYVTRRLEIATEFDEPICSATLEAFDDHVDGVEKSLGRLPNRDPILVYWLDDVDDTCGEGKSGCFFPGTRVVFSTGESITHEIVHAVLDSTATTYFVEEGIAEMFSGVDVYHNTSHDDESDLAARLRLDRSDYRAGRLDYAAAAHFMRYVYDRKGDFAMRNLADVIVAGGSETAIEHQLENIFGAGIDEIQAEYIATARYYYRGFGAEGIDRADGLQLGYDVRLDCDDGELTHGPLTNDEAGVYSVRRVNITRTGVATIRVIGDGDAWVSLFDPTARRGIVTNWSIPDARVDPDAITVRAGDTVRRRLDPGTYLAVFAASGDDSDVRLELDMPRVPPVGDENGGPTEGTP